MKKPQIILYSTITLAVVAVGVAASYSWLNQPVVSPGLPQVMSTNQQKPVNYQLKTDYFVSQVDGMSKRNPSAGDSPGVLARVLAGSAHPVDGDFLAITIAKLPPNGLADVSDINLRKIENQTYQPVQLDNLPEGAVAFRAKSRYEVSVFWPHQGNYASIVLTGRVDRASDLERHMVTVLSNWQWL